jgi:transcriptional regulator with XRE-family HTH domain
VPRSDREYLVALGERVKIIRRARRVSKVAAGQRAGLDRIYLGRLEGGCHNPTAVTLRHLARALGVPVPLLVDEKATPLRVLRLLGNTEPHN